jgi:hypothetical protein
VRSFPVSPHRVAAAKAGIPAGDLALPKRASSSLRFTVRYFPCFGVIPLVVALLLSAPLAIWARQESRFPSWVSCIGAFRSPPSEGATSLDAKPAWQTQPTCAARDARVIVNSTQLPCNALLAALDSLVDSTSLLRRSILHGAESRPAMESGVTYSSPDPSSRIDPASARALLARCIASAPAVGTPRTVEVMVLDCDYAPSVGVGCAVLALAALAGLRRRIVVRVDLAHGEIALVERGFLREQRTVVIDTRRVHDVVVAAGPAGFLSGRRVEVVCSDGDRIPLTEGFVAMTFGVHRRVARRLSAYVEGAHEMRRISGA